MTRYETIAIIDPDLSEEGREPVLARVNQLVDQAKGYFIKTDEWGSKKLAYEIKKKLRGFYVAFDYCGDGVIVDEIERFFRIDDRVIKYMTVVQEKDADIDAIKAALAAEAAEAAETAESVEAAATDATAGAVESAVGEFAETEVAEAPQAVTAEQDKADTNTETTTTEKTEE
jgi:small subunit ribosomal protein S6